MMPPIGGNPNTLLSSPHSSYLPIGGLGGTLGQATSHLTSNGQMQSNKNVGGMPPNSKYGLNPATSGPYGSLGPSPGPNGRTNVNTSGARKANQSMGGTSLLNSQTVGLPHMMNNKNGLCSFIQFVVVK